MATDKQDFGGLASAMDLSKTPIYGTEPSQLQDLQKAQQQALSALEQRYAQPNWFKVAAGFAKPQLGGFFASLGSASEALGENVEQQRAQMLPIAQMRAQLAQTNLLLDQNKTVSNMLTERNAKGLPLTPDFVREVVARAPDSSIAKALQSELASQQKQQELTSSQQRLMLDSIQMKQAKGMPLSQPELDFLNNLPSLLSQRTEAKPLLESGQPIEKGTEVPISSKVEESSASTQTSAPKITSERRAQIEGDIAAIKREISRLPANDSRHGILQNEIKKLQEKLGEAEPSNLVGGKFYPESFPAPNLQGKADWERTERGQAWGLNAKAEEQRNVNFVNQYSQMAVDPNYTALNSQFNTAINLIENNPTLAKKVFNTLRGSGELKNQIMSALNEGAGVNLGSMVANINLPIKNFLTSGFTPDEQKYADRLIHSLLILGNADLAMRGITPEKGQKAYFDNLVTKANLDQNAETALNILHENKVKFDLNKNKYDTLIDERAKYSNPESLTPYTDVLRNSAKIKQLEKDAEEKLNQYKTMYQDMLNRKSKR